MLGYAGANPAYPETPIKCLSEKIFFQTGILLSNQPLPSNPIANSSHDFGSQLHHFFYRQRQFGGAEVVRHFGVFHFVQTHLRDYGAAFAVLFRQAFEVFFQVAGDLIFGFFQKAQIPFVAQQAGADADGERTGVSYRIEQAGASAQFVYPFFRPG